jgi:hypothetical protein
MQQLLFAILSAAAISAGETQLPVETIVVPSGYVGWAMIVFPVPSSSPTEYEGGVPLYHIPKTGVLPTQNTPNLLVNPAWRFFYEGPDGSRVPVQFGGVPPRGTPEERADPATRGFFEGGGRIGPCQYALFFIGSNAQALASNRADGLTRFDHQLASMKCG